MTFDLEKIKKDIQKAENLQPVSLNKTSTALQPRRMSKGPRTNFGKGTVFLCDTSGSMYGEKLYALKEAVHEFVEQDIKTYEFNSQVNLLTSVSQLFAVVARGTTKMLAALKTCYQDEPNNIIMITDGQPDENKQDILDLAAEKQIPIQCIMLPSSDVDRKFLEDLCNASGGGIFTDLTDIKLLGQTIAGLIEYKEEKKQAIQL
uniref:Putative von Willebrand factor A domain-containing protein n=1 Tax=viral metagenome TaxID=1070528 RepID=A0A6M3J0Y7_9ZZZZ